MSRILVVGGYGGFGGRLVRRLAGSGHEVLVGGRSIKRAEAFCSNLPNCRPVQIDRAGDVSATLARERPDIVIDAAGPFQGLNYALPEACIEARVHYLDLADARDFVLGIGELDERARSAGVAVISGASSVPALSQAVAEHLRIGMESAVAVEVSISASSRASAGKSVAVAILSGVGKPLSVWEGGRWVRKRGWQSVRKERLELPSGKGIGSRLVALANVPDLTLFPNRLPGVSAVSFRAGTESALATLALWAGSLLVQAGAIRSLRPVHGFLLPLHRLTAIWGGDRSGMLVRAFGTIGGRRLERRWTLIANKGDGPEIPVLAAVILADRIGAGKVPPGARDAGGQLTLGDFEAGFASLAVEHAVVDVAQPAALYRRVMGDHFDRLSPAIQFLHSILRDRGASGRAKVERGSAWAGRLIAGMMRFPPAGDHELHVHFEERGGVERWTRDFGGHRFSSRLRAGKPGQVIEAFGPLRFKFELSTDDGSLSMDMKGWSLGPIPLPKFLAPRSEAREWEENGRFHFDVPVDLPLIGPIIRYRGWLKA